MKNVGDGRVRGDGVLGRMVVVVRDVSRTFEAGEGKVDGLSNVSLQIADGEFVSFIGPSGCGKTTILRVIADLQQPTAGTLLVHRLSAGQGGLARRDGYVSQEPALFPVARVCTDPQLAQWHRLVSRRHQPPPSW